MYFESSILVKRATFGITFDNNLVKMQQNFEIKIEEIEKLLSHWSYRYLTPFGKVTIIKSLALSKLSHVALVIPNPTKQMFKRIENIFYNEQRSKFCCYPENVHHL